LIVVATALVLASGTPLGVLTNAVQTLAGVLLPSASVFLQLLYNDRAVLGLGRNRATSVSSPASWSQRSLCCH
jgi:Mn2+/Fe2+ NRAMP family transporter